MKKVYIEWVDAYTLDAWQPTKEAIELTEHEYLVKTMGYLLKETDGFVIICHSFTEVSVMGVLHVPRSCIKKFEEI